MTTAGYFNTGKKLEEGKSYPFRVHSTITLQDARVYFILEDPFNIRHLLPLWLYAKYGINQGQIINCTVDKINCTGRVYLEPLHPHYSKGRVYEFQCQSVQMNEHRRKPILILTDIFNNDIEVDCPQKLVKSISESISVECKVLDIRKGKPVLIVSKYFKDKKVMLSTVKQTL